MSRSEFKNVSVLASGKELVVSRFLPPQGSFATIISNSFNILAIRKFFIRKLRFSFDTLDQKLAAALHEFPGLAEVRPFYDELCHIFCPLEYTLALDRLKAARGTIRETEKRCRFLLNFGGSLNGVKCLTVYALGAMCSAISEIEPHLAYLEQVRKHLVVFPRVDPNADKIEFVGYPRGGIDALILRWLDRLEQALGLSQADEEFKLDGRDLNPEEEAALISTRINKRLAESRSFTPPRCDSDTN